MLLLTGSCRSHTSEHQDDEMTSDDKKSLHINVPVKNCKKSWSIKSDTSSSLGSVGVRSRRGKWAGKSKRNGRLSSSRPAPGRTESPRVVSRLKGSEGEASLYVTCPVGADTCVHAGGRALSLLQIHDTVTSQSVCVWR